MASRLTLEAPRYTVADRRRRQVGSRFRVKRPLARYGRGSCMRLRRRVGAQRRRFHYPLSRVSARIAFGPSVGRDC